jgi:subtilisin family serine protease
VIGVRAKGATKKTKTNKTTMKQKQNPQPHFSRHERLKKSIGRKACLMFTLLAVSLSQVPAQQVSNPAVPTADAKTVDAGDSYTADGQVLKLKRITHQIVVKSRAGAAKYDGNTTEMAGGGSLRRVQTLGDSVAVWQDNAGASDEATRLQNLLAAAQADPEVEYAYPVYLVEGHDLRLYGGDEIVLQLKLGTSLEAFRQLLQEQGLSLVRALPRFEDTYIARLTSPKADDGLAAVARLMTHPDVEWAEHHFPQEIRAQITPSDPYFASEQWHHAHNSGFGADSNANIKTPDAWTGSQPYGSPGVVIAVLDNGVQTNHPELAGNILPGYDFRSGDNDPNPATGDDNHGTAVAGMIAAVADGNGSVGGAPNCKILPVRVFEGSSDACNSSLLAEAIMWAADNADIINCSWKTCPSTLVTSAFSYATTSGRGGKGAVVTVAAGNAASRWDEITNDFITPGTPVPAGNWRYRFVMDNFYQPLRTSRAQIAFVRFPNGTVERFDSPGIPTGWTSDTPATPWSTTDDLANSHGVGRYYLSSAPYLENSDDSIVTTHEMAHSTTTKMRVLLYIENPTDEVVRFKLYGSNNGGDWQELFGQYGWGVYSANRTIQYPASLSTTLAVGASTDWDYRADYSCHETYTLDFLAPSGGGYKTVFTTDRTGSDGYNGFSGSQNYTYQSGTSFASPLAASVAALVLSRNGHLTWTQVRDLMRNNAEKVKSSTVTYDGSGYNAQFGYGRLHAANAVAAVTADTTTPTFTSASVQTTRSIDLVFSEPMGGAIYTPSSYTISGAGKGTLANNPSQVIRLAPSKYRLVWNAGGMVVGTVTISTSGLKDVAGNALASPTSRSSTGTKAIELVNGGSSTVLPYGSSDPRTPWLSDDVGFWVGNQFIKYNASQVGYTGSTSSSINLSGVTGPAPEAVYQTARMAWYTDGTPSQWLTMKLPGVLPYESCKVRLHFSEMYWSNIGDQIFNLRINNSNPGNYPDYWNYDILGQTSGVQNKAAIVEFTVTNGSGPLRIDLEQRPSSGQFPYYNATLNGVEVLRP